MTPSEYRRANPESFFLDAEEGGALATWMRSAGILGRGETISSMGPAGPGNMNCTIRVVAGERSFIVKQSRPWVEKYPQFDAPEERSCREAEFYEMITSNAKLRVRMPRLLHHDRRQRLLVLEDLGTDGDYSDLYAGGILSVVELDELVGYLNELHKIRRSLDCPSPLPNREMRALNHAHVFVIPMKVVGGPDLDAIVPGLERLAADYRADAALAEAVEWIGRDVYLADGTNLVHGDFFPGSFIRTKDGPKVIDPEFGFFGRPEWDGGVLLGHMILAQQPAKVTDQCVKSLSDCGGMAPPLVFQVAGVEILRRVLGYAQLPLRGGLEARAELLKQARELVLRPDSFVVDQFHLK